jgi:hypothetical protein
MAPTEKDGGVHRRPFHFVSNTFSRLYLSISRTFSASSISVSFTSITSFMVV